MNAIRDYLVQVIAAALICGAIGNMVDKKGSIGLILKILCGIFMTMTILAPVSNIRLTELPELIFDYTADAGSYVEMGKENA